MKFETCFLKPQHSVSTFLLFDEDILDRVLLIQMMTTKSKSFQHLESHFDKFLLSRTQRDIITQFGKANDCKSLGKSQKARALPRQKKKASIEEKTLRDILK